MITVTNKKNLSVGITNGRHEIISDVGQDQGGDDAGLTPHELVEAALAACTNLTLELYAKRKGWDIAGLKTQVKIVKEGKDTLFERHVTFGPQNSIEEKKRLIEIANKCPLHNLLESNIEIETYEK